MAGITATDRPLPEVAGVRHGYHRVDGVQLHVAEAGGGPPVVLLHGWPQHWYEWRDVIPPLSERYRVVCPDLRGFGWSEAPPRGYDKETLARDVLGLVDELGIERFRLAGHDWGGWLGFLICLWAPERVERFLPLNIAHPFSRISFGAILAFWRLWYQYVIAAPWLGRRVVSSLATLGRPVARWGGAGPPAWDDEAQRTFFGQFAEPERARASVLLYRTFIVRDMPRMITGRYRRTRLTTPTLMLWGDGDKVVRPPFFADHERYADEMRIERVRDCSHFIVDERPELVADRALEFFG